MREFNYEELLDKLSKIEIRLEGDEVVTLYNGSERARKKVSDKYEIFDFRPFMIDRINEIMEMYEIESYKLETVGGRQEIRLFSHPEYVGDEQFQRAFYLLNSSDKSRALSFSYGLKHNRFHFISKKGTIYKKHYTGITEYVNERVDMDDKVFQEQIEIIKKLIGDKIYMSNVQKIVTESDELVNSKTTLKKNFAELCKNIYYRTYGSNEMTESQRKSLMPNWKTGVTDFNDREKDFQVDSFLVFQSYLSLFQRRDAAIIRKESDRISKLSVLENRNDSIEQLLADL